MSLYREPYTDYSGSLDMRIRDYAGLHDISGHNYNSALVFVITCSTFVSSLTVNSRKTREIIFVFFFFFPQHHFIPIW